MVVRVDHARHQQVVARVDHLVGHVRHVAGRADGGDQAIAHQHRSLAQLLALVVLRGHGVGVVYQQSGHAPIVP